MFSADELLWQGDGAATGPVAHAAAAEGYTIPTRGVTA